VILTVVGGQLVVPANIFAATLQRRKLDFRMNNSNLATPKVGSPNVDCPLESIDNSLNHLDQIVEAEIVEASLVESLDVDPSSGQQKAFAILKMVGGELLLYVLITVAASMMVGPFVGAWIAVWTGDLAQSQGTGVFVSAAVMSLLYGLSLSTNSDLFQRQYRACVCSAWFVLAAVASFIFSGISVSTLLPLFPIAGWLAGRCCLSPSTAIAKPKPTIGGRVGKEVISFVVGIAFVIGLKIATIHSVKYAHSTIHSGKQAPATVFSTSEGEDWTFAAENGKVILVEYWAPWCGPCVAEFPHLSTIHDRYGDREDFVMVSVTRPRYQEQAEQLFKDRQLSWELIYNSAQAADGDFKPSFIPAAYVIGRDGQVVASHIRGAEIDSCLESLLGEGTNSSDH